jgi:carbonic anhydrase
MSFSSPDIVRVESDEQLDCARTLFREYAASAGADLCFQSFDKELAELPGEYAPPSGRLLLAFADGRAAGCVALRRIDAARCEMKRLYARPEFRGCGIGRSLVTTIIAEARSIGYGRMLLDTLPWMKEAISLYRSFGFTETAPYRHNPVEGALFMELDLHSAGSA